jgi:hypothetical protein
MFASFHEFYSTAAISTGSTFAWTNITCPVCMATRMPSLSESDPKLKDVQAPWNSWELDHAFIQNFSNYITDHPDSTLCKILQCVVSAMEAGRDNFLGLIPNSPKFPAQSFVLAIGQLIQLGLVSAAFHLVSKRL